MVESNCGRTAEHDELLLELRRVDAEFNSSHDHWLHEHARLMSEKNSLEERIRNLREKMELPYVNNLCKLRTAAERVAGLEKPGADAYALSVFNTDDLCGKPAIHIRNRGDAISAIAGGVNQLAPFMSKDTNNREHINRLYWALVDATTALCDALDPFADASV